MKRLILSMLAVFLLASCTVVGSILLTGCSQSQTEGVKEESPPPYDDLSGDEDSSEFDTTKDPEVENGIDSENDEFSDSATSGVVTFCGAFTTKNKSLAASLTDAAAQFNQYQAAATCYLVASTSSSTTTIYNSEIGDGTGSWLGKSVSGLSSSNYTRFYLTSTSTGFTFDGWWWTYEEDNGDGMTGYFSRRSTNTNYFTTAQYTLGKDVFAVFVASSVTVTLDNQSATTAGTTSTTAYYTYPMTSITIPKKTGYTFKGYYTGVGGSGTQYYTSTGSSAKACDFTSAKTLYAYWVADAHTNVYYYRNSSGTATSTTQSRTYGSSFTTLSSTALSYYTSNGWSLYGWVYGSSTSTTRTYAASTSVTDTTYTNSTSVLYWYAISSRTVSLTYNTNGGTYSGSTSYGTQYWNQYGTTRTAVSLTVTSTAPTRTGYTFLGWATSSTATSSNYAAGSTYSFSAAYSSAASATLYAVWSVNGYTISFNKNGGTAGSATISATYGTSYTFPTATAAGSSTGFANFTRTGYTLSSWNSNTSGTGTSYTLGGAYSNLSSANGATVTLYAVWTINSYKLTVNYSASGTASTTYNKLSVSATSGTVASSTVSSGSSTTITANYSVSSITVTVGRASTSYTWYIYAGTSSTTVPTTSSATNSTTYIWTPTANATIYVKMYQRYTISYNKGYGTGTAPSTQYKIYNGSVTLATNNLTLSGCEAKGWNTSSTGTGTAYANGASYSTNANLTLYTAWTARNPLKYDSTFKYFYFEDGEYPQTYAGTYSSLSSSLTSTGEEMVYSNPLTLDGDMSKWTKYYSANSTTAETVGISYSSSTKMNRLIVNGIAGWEIIGLTLSVSTETDYTVSFKYSIGGFLTCNNSGIVPVQVVSSIQNNDNSSTVLASGSMTPNSSGIVQFSFNSGSYTTLYLIVNCGYFSDFTQYELYVGNFSLAEQVSIPVYKNSSNVRYAVVTAPTTCTIKLTNSDKTVSSVTFTAGTKYCFKFEPIRWRVSDYGVSSTEYPSGWSSYASYNTNFTAVSDLILGFGAMNSTRSVSEGTAVSSMSGFVNVQNTTLTCAVNGEYSTPSTSLMVDRYGVTVNGEGNAVYNDTTVTYTSPLRVASIEEIEELGINNKSARASHMVAMLMGQNDTNCSYWTRGLSNLGSGVAISATGTEIRSWLDVSQGIRFAYTFSEGVRM